MLLKGNSRGGSRQLALHLMNGEMNEQVQLHEIRGFVAENVMGALNESYAISKGTQCKKFMYSLSLSPPQDEFVKIAAFEQAIEKIEQSLGLNEQPRVVVFHEKEGPSGYRRHAHVVWSRIEPNDLKAIQLSFDRDKLHKLSKSLYLEHGWQMPRGFRDQRYKDPLNYSRAEWQQALRSGRNPKDIRAEIQECYAISDNKNAFQAALKDSGFKLAKGDRRGFVVVDYFGQVYGLRQMTGKSVKEQKARLGDPDTLPSVSKTKAEISNTIKPVLDNHISSLERDHKRALQPLLQEKQQLLEQQTSERAELEDFLKNRWQAEDIERNARIRRGMKALKDRITGQHFRLQKLNEKESWKAHLRDQKLRDEMIYRHLSEHQTLHEKTQEIKQHQDQERQNLLRDIGKLDLEQLQEHAAFDLPHDIHPPALDKERDDMGHGL